MIQSPVASSRRARVRVGGGIAARLGLRQGEGDERPAGGEVREPARLLLVGAGEEERQRAKLLDRQDQPAGRADAADLLDREADGQQLAAQPAVLGRERQAEDVVGGEEILDVPGKFGGPVDLGRPRRDPLVGQHTDRVAEHLLLLGQAVGPGIRRG